MSVVLMGTKHEIELHRNLGNATRKVLAAFKEVFPYGRLATWQFEPPYGMPFTKQIIPWDGLVRRRCDADRTPGALLGRVYGLDKIRFAMRAARLAVRRFPVSTLAPGLPRVAGVLDLLDEIGESPMVIPFNGVVVHQLSKHATRIRPQGSCWVRAMCPSHMVFERLMKSTNDPSTVNQDCAGLATLWPDGDVTIAPSNPEDELLREWDMDEAFESIGKSKTGRPPKDLDPALIAEIATLVGGGSSWSEIARILGEDRGNRKGVKMSKDGWRKLYGRHLERHGSAG
jgi:hypothetical protein